MLKSIVVLDHKIAEWRFRHVQMVEKMLGQKIGTGGVWSRLPKRNR